MPVEKKTISMPKQMFADALKRSRILRYKSFSEYIQYLVEQDLRERPRHSTIREEPPGAPLRSQL